MTAHSGSRAARSDGSWSPLRPTVAARSPGAAAAPPPVPLSAKSLEEGPLAKVVERQVERAIENVRLTRTDYVRITDRVVSQLGRRLRVEKERRGHA